MAVGGAVKPALKGERATVEALRSAFEAAMPHKRDRLGIHRRMLRRSVDRIVDDFSADGLAAFEIVEAIRMAALSVGLGPENELTVDAVRWGTTGYYFGGSL